ncbi:SCP2 sterol-binding domain-containing protein [Thermoplasmatota archaeon]
MVKFLSKQWIEAARKIVAEEIDPDKDLMNASASLLNVINNVPPDGKTIYFYISVKNGNILELKTGQNNSLMEKNTEFTVSGNYDTYKQIFKGEMSLLIALIKNRIEIKGDKKKALKFVKPIDRLNSFLRKIDTKY